MLKIPPVTPAYYEVRQLDDDPGEWVAVASHPFVGDGGEGSYTVAWISYERGEDRPYLVDPVRLDGYYIARRRTKTLREAKSIARQVARKFLGFVAARQVRFRGCIS